MKTTSMFSPWNRAGKRMWERQKGGAMLNHQKNMNILRRMKRDASICMRAGKCRNRMHQSSSIFTDLVCAPIFSPGVSVRGEAAGEWLALFWCLSGWGQGSQLGLSFPPDPFLDANVAYRSRWLTSFCMELTRKSSYMLPLWRFS